MTAAVRHFVDIDDLSPAELRTVLDLAGTRPPRDLLSGRGVALMFEKPSLRTRNSCEMAVVQLGGHPVTIFNDEIRLGERESIEDATRVLQGYYSVLAARVFSHQKVERMAATAAVPVINLLSDDAHPCQALADLLTIRQRFGDLAGLTLGWVGDFTNVARSLLSGALMSGMDVRLSNPPGYGPTDAEFERALLVAEGGASVVQCARPVDAVTGASVVATDSFVSMGQEDEAAVRHRAFEGFRVDRDLMSVARADAVFLHCLPAHRGDEVTGDVIDGPQSLVFPEAHNRMHSFRGLLMWLLNSSGEA